MLLFKLFEEQKKCNNETLYKPHLIENGFRVLFASSREYLLATAMEKRSQSYDHQSSFGVISQVDQQPFLPKTRLKAEAGIAEPFEARF